MRHRELGSLVRGLHLLGYDCETKRLGQCQARGDDRGVLRVVPEPLDKGAVDLEHIRREPLEGAERREPGTEVINSDGHTEFIQRLEGAKQVLGVPDEHGLGDLKAQKA